MTASGQWRTFMLITTLLDAQLPGVVGYACSMKKNAVWAQHGESIQNPYFGKVMLDCGVRLKNSR